MLWQALELGENKFTSLIWSEGSIIGIEEIHSAVDNFSIQKGTEVNVPVEFLYGEIYEKEASQLCVLN